MASVKEEAGGQEVSLADVGGRKFLVIEGLWAIPVDAIRDVELNVTWNDQPGCVKITPEAGERYNLTGERAANLRAFLARCKLPVGEV